MASPATLSCLLITIVVFTTCVSSSTAITAGRKVGGRTDVVDVETNEQVQELGRFSVEEFNEIQKKHGQDGGAMWSLTFTRVVKAQMQVVSGIKYYLQIEATRRGVTKMFDSTVVVKPWVNSKVLLNFAPVSSAY